MFLMNYNIKYNIVSNTIIVYINFIYKEDIKYEYIEYKIEGLIDNNILIHILLCNIIMQYYSIIYIV